MLDLDHVQDGYDEPQQDPYAEQLPSTKADQQQAAYGMPATAAKHNPSVTRSHDLVAWILFGALLTSLALVTTTPKAGRFWLIGPATAFRTIMRTYTFKWKTKVLRDLTACPFLAGLGFILPVLWLVQAFLPLCRQVMLLPIECCFGRKPAVRVFQLVTVHHIRTYVC